MEIRPVPSTLKAPAAGAEREQAAAHVAATASPAGAALIRTDTVAAAVPADEAENGLRQAVERINQSLPASSQGIEFSIDEDSDRVIVKVVDRETREVLRQMPSQEALEIAKALDRTQGLLIKLEA